MDSINKVSLKEKLQTYKKNPFSFLLFLAVTLSAVITAVVIIVIIGYILIKGVPNITPELFAWEYNSTNVSMLPSLINTLIMTFLALLIAVPFGIGAAIYLVEYAKRGNKIVGLVRITAETLSGIPSIVYGLFGMLLFVIKFGWGMSLIAGASTLAIMILPLIMRTTEEALKSVPDAYREGSFGLGAGRIRTVFKIVLPAASPGILAGIILGVGRIVGETAALIYTAGTVAKIPSGRDFLFDSTRTLSSHMYTLSREGLYTEQAYATAVVLLLIVIAINQLSMLVARRITKGQ